MERLFVYGSLQPGGANEHMLADLGGEWQPATIQGVLHEAGWGAQLGYPGLVLQEDNQMTEKSQTVHGYVLTSAGLADYWTELDAFEGEEYERVFTIVTLASGENVAAYVYIIRR